MKNKYNRGHPVKEEWHLGRVKRITEQKIFMEEVPSRTETPFFLIIRSYVLPGSIVITDCVPSYSNLKNYSIHQSGKPFPTFRDPITTSDTNIIKGFWNAFKYQIVPRNMTNSLDEDKIVVGNHLNNYVGEFGWRRDYSADFWNRFLHALPFLLGVL
ncbi:hypothetical protein HZS_7792 [Henneguya salminicola]|nr:hypothetical protein HZS_7792 [Henneguya salminicola]